MTSNQRQHDEWQDCPAGEISQMVGRLNTSQRQARRKQLFGQAAVCMLFVATGVFVIGSVFSANGQLHGGITCSECQEHFADYHHFQTDAVAMDDAFALSMATHLEKCERCRMVYLNEYPGELSARLPVQAAVPLFAVASVAPLY